MEGFTRHVLRRYVEHLLGMLGLFIVIFFVLVGIYAPFLASSKPLFVAWNGRWYFPLFRYLFYQGFFTKKIDLFFNILMFTFPLFLLLLIVCSGNVKRRLIGALLILQFGCFGALVQFPMENPAADGVKSQARHHALRACEDKKCFLSWDEELAYLSPYAKLNLIVQHILEKEHDDAIRRALEARGASLKAETLPTLWDQKRQQLDDEKTRLMQGGGDSESESKLDYLLDKERWLAAESDKVTQMIMPLLRSYHFEDDAGGEMVLNKHLPWWELTRTNRKDLMAALLFGTRISLVVGFLAVGIALLIGVPIGALAGYFGGRTDIALSRLLEVWEAMPTLFMLLMIVAILQTKSIFVIILVVGIFGWTSFSRFIRGEFLKQRNLPYVEACRSLGFGHCYIMLVHILPNAIPPLLTLLPFAVMGAITNESGLSFLGLGEEGSCSWGVLMEEGRSAFPAESYLLWPPAFLLTTLLVSIALVGDALRDALDPKMS